MSLSMHTTQRVAARTNGGILAVRATEFVAIFLQALVVGAFWGSWIGLSRSIDTLTPGTFLEVGHVMMADYGPIMSVLMPAAVLATLLAAVLVYRRQATAGYLVLAGFACVVGATAASWSGAAAWSRRASAARAAQQAERSQASRRRYSSRMRA